MGGVESCVPCTTCGARRGQACMSVKTSETQLYGAVARHWAHFTRWNAYWEWAKLPLLVQKMLEATDDDAVA